MKGLSMDKTLFVSFSGFTSSRSLGISGIRVRNNAANMENAISKECLYEAHEDNLEEGSAT